LKVLEKSEEDERDGDRGAFWRHCSYTRFRYQAFV